MGFTSVGGKWTIFEPQGAGGKFKKYANQLVAIVSRSNKGKKHPIAKLYFTEKVFGELKKPEYVQIGKRGSNIGVFKVETQKGAYKVGHHSYKKNDERFGMPFISIQAFASMINLQPGVYEAHMEGGVLVFDQASLPSEI